MKGEDFLHEFWYVVSLSPFIFNYFLIQIVFYFWGCLWVYYSKLPNIRSFLSPISGNWILAGVQWEHFRNIVCNFNAAMLVETGFILASPNDKNFWEDGIMKRPAILQKAVEQNGECIVQYRYWWKWKTSLPLGLCIKTGWTFWPNRTVFQVCVSAAISRAFQESHVSGRWAGKVVDCSRTSMNVDCDVI